MKILISFLCAAATAQVLAGETMIRPDLVYSKTFGGRGSDYGIAVAVDSAGNVYVAGNTTSLDFPVKNAAQPQIGGTNLRASADGGKTWTAPSIPEGVYAMAGSAKAPGVLYAGTSRTIYKSLDGGKTWTALPTAPLATINALTADPVDPAAVYAATSVGIMKSQDAGASWKTVGRGGSNIIVLAMNASRPGTLLAGGTGTSSPALYRSTDAGASWTVLSNAPLGVFALVSDPSNPDIFYAAASPQGFSSAAVNVAIYKTTDSGSSWTKATDAPVTISTFALAATSTAVFAGTQNGLIRSTDGGATWSAAGLSGNVGIGNLAVDPGDLQTIYAAPDSVYASRDGGKTWTQVLAARQVVQVIAVTPGTPGGLFVGATPGQNIFITKWSGDGRQMLYSTYLGSSYYDNARGIAVDRQGNAYVTGYTYGTDFPVTRGALQTKTGSPYTAFVAKISPDGGTLAYSTYLGGSEGDAAFAIAVDAVGSAYVTGYAGSADFPVTAGAMRTRLVRNCSPGFWDGPNPGDAFVTKLNGDFSALVYSTFLGGGCEDQGNGIAVDSAGSAHVVGTTTSADFPVTKGAVRATAANGYPTGFVAQLTPQGTLAAASFVGGDFGTTAAAVALDSKSNVYISGCTNGFDQAIAGGGFAGFGSYTGATLPAAGFPVTCVGAAYVLEVDAAATRRTYLKYLGNHWSGGNSIAVDGQGKAWVAGYSSPINNSDAVPSIHPLQAKMGQGFVSELSATGEDVLFSSRADTLPSVALDGSGNAFLGGYSAGTRPHASVTRIDGAVASAVTAEEPQRLPPGDPLRDDRGVAPGQIVTITGVGLGPAQAVGAQIGADGKVATSLGGTTVTFDGVPTPLISSQENRVVCIVPFGVGNTTTMQVQSNGAASNSIRLPVVGTAIEIVAVVNEDGSVNSTDHPAKANSVATVYAAGFGQTSPPGVDGQINGGGAGAPRSGPAHVTVGQQDATVLYFGPAPGQVAGIVQVNFRIPDLPDGAYQVSVGAGGDSDVAALKVAK